MTTITDAFGTFHDISIEAFNSFSIQIPHMMGNTDLRNMDFSKAFKQLGGKSFSTDLLQKIQDISPEAKALLETAAQQIESRALSVAAQTFTELEKSVPVAGFLLGCTSGDVGLRNDTATFALVIDHRKPPNLIVFHLGAAFVDAGIGGDSNRR